MPSVTLCTQTYNDAVLAHELLKATHTWTREPDAIVVVDDGSSPPFELAEDEKQKNGKAIRLIRLAANGGVTTAKSTSMSAAETDLILLMDCDIRPAPDWLESAIPVAMQPDIGIVGFAITHDAGAGVVGRYLRHFDALHAKQGDMDFLPGCVWLVRRDVWLATNGFDGYTCRTQEDLHFCGLINRLGLRIVTHGEGGTQVRRLSRLALIKRFANWFRENVSQGVNSLKALEVKALLMADDSVQRIDYALRHAEPLFIYIEMLLFARLGSMSAQALGTHCPSEGKYAAEALVQAFYTLCAPYKKLSALLKEDFRALGIDTSAAHDGIAPSVSACTPSATNPWDAPLKTFETLEHGGLFRQLEAMTPLLREEEGARAHFSFYTEL